LAHNHNHSHDNQNYSKAFAIGIGLNVVYIIVEVMYGLIVNSLALIADAGHNLSDVLGLLLAWGASYLVSRKPTRKYTYGFKKSSVLAAFLNALILLVAIGAIIWEAVSRFAEPQIIEGKTIMIVAGIGVIINGVTALLFYNGRKKDLNIKGAFLHMAADAGISFGVVLVGFILTFTNYYWLDPVVSIIIGILIFWGTWGLLKDSVNLALDAVPENIKTEEVEKYFNNCKYISGFHDLHIWAMSTTETALTVHVIVDGNYERNKVIRQISNDLHEHFEIVHTTIQIENKQEKECTQNSI
jgi:cobalt-zinc-cadmium efflux system protein